MMPQGKPISLGNLPGLPGRDAGTEHREIFTQALCSVWGSVRGINSAWGLLLTWWNRHRRGKFSLKRGKEQKRGAKQKRFLLCQLLLEDCVLVNWGFEQLSLKALHSQGYSWSYSCQWWHSLKKNIKDDYLYSMKHFKYTMVGFTNIAKNTMVIIVFTY